MEKAELPRQTLGDAAIVNDSSSSISARSASTTSTVSVTAVGATASAPIPGPVLRGGRIRVEERHPSESERITVGPPPSSLTTPILRRPLSNATDRSTTHDQRMPYGTMDPPNARLIRQRKIDDERARIRARIRDLAHNVSQVSVIDVMYDELWDRWSFVRHRRSVKRVCVEWKLVGLPERISRIQLSNDMRLGDADMLKCFYDFFVVLNDMNYEYYISKEIVDVQLLSSERLHERAADAVMDTFVGPIRRRLVFYVLVVDMLETKLLARLNEVRDTEARLRKQAAEAEIRRGAPPMTFYTESDSHDATIGEDDSVTGSHSNTDSSDDDDDASSSVEDDQSPDNAAPFSHMRNKRFGKRTLRKSKK